MVSGSSYRGGGLSPRHVGEENRRSLRRSTPRSVGSRCSWDWGLLHDGIVRKYGYERLYARYRSQYTFNPTVEFECPAVAEPLRMLLRDTPIQPDDNIQNLS